MIRLVNLCELLAGVLLLGLCLLTMADVVGRQLLNSPIAVAGSASELLLAAIALLAMPKVSLRGAHITVDILNSMFRAWQHRVMRAFNGLLGAVIFALMAWRFYDYAEKQAQYNSRVAQIGWPLSYVYMGLMVLSILTALAFAVYAFRRRPIESQTPEEA